MLFLVNPGQKKKPRRVTRRRKRPAKSGAKPAGGFMARRRRRRSRAVARSHAAPRRRSVRRRRRSVAVIHANAPRRRRRRSVVRSVARRRHYRRNPPASVRGILGAAKTDAVNGLTILAGEIGQNKVVGLVDKFVPAMTGTGAILRAAGINVVIAVGGSLAARKVVPGRATMIAGGMWSRAWANILALTPAAALLGDDVVFDPNMQHYAAYPQVGAGFSAYPNVATADVSHAEH